ncbi:hypothetical protein D3C81_2171490 [compost metagenome]
MVMQREARARLELDEVRTFPVLCPDSCHPDAGKAGFNVFTSGVGEVKHVGLLRCDWIRPWR